MIIRRPIKPSPKVEVRGASYVAADEQRRSKPSPERIAEALPRIRRARGVSLKTEQVIEEMAEKLDASTYRIFPNRDRTIDAELRIEVYDDVHETLDDILSQYRQPGKGWYMSIGGVWEPDDVPEESGQAYRGGTMLMTGRFKVKDRWLAMKTARDIFEHIKTDPTEIILRFHSSPDSKLARNKGRATRPRKKEQ